MHDLIIIAILLLITVSCSNPYTDDIYAPLPAGIVNDSLIQSKQLIGVDYVWGGRSTNGVDCSGLVVVAYRSAIESTVWDLPFRDATVKTLLNKHTIEIDIDDLIPGDLLFMGDDHTTHVAMYISRSDGNMNFIDSFSTTGRVTIRSYDENSYKFHSFGRMLGVRK